MKLRMFALGQCTRYGEHTVARVLAPNAKTAGKLFREWYRQRGLPQTKGTTIGLDIGSIQLTMIEEGRPDIPELKPRTVTPIGPAKDTRQPSHHGIVLQPFPTSPKKSTPKPRRNKR